MGAMSEKWAEQRYGDGIDVDMEYDRKVMRDLAEFFESRGYHPREALAFTVQFIHTILAVDGVSPDAFITAFKSLSLTTEPPVQ